MPKGRHKGGRRHFTNFEAVEEEKKKEEKARQWREQRGESNSEDEESGSDESEEESESSSSEEEEKEVKAKGVSNLIETANPNRVVQKTKKVTALTPDEGTAKPQLTRRQREEMEKQRAAAHYRKMHAAGKTEEARSDLARLALIKQQREEAARKKEEEKKSKEAAVAAKRDQLAKVLNKKS